jgi:hypothetical protein
MDLDICFRALIVYGICTGVLPCLILLAIITIVKGVNNTAKKIKNTDYTPVSKEERKEVRLQTFSQIGNRI